MSAATARHISIADYAAAVAQAAAAGCRTVDYGIAHAGLGYAPPPDAQRIAPPTEGFVHWQADLSAHVPGGMTIGQLQQRLGEAGQFLPLDADDDMTIAEGIAHNVSGPLRLTHGTCVDLMLGLQYVDAAGTLITVGGRTVKNVAGYDVSRLLIGNYNTLGLIAAANLRTAAIPPQITRVELRGVDLEKLTGESTALLTCDAAPWALQFVGGAARGGEQLFISYCGSARACEAQCAALAKFLQQAKLSHEPPKRVDVKLDEDSAFRRDLRAWRRSAAGHVQIVIPPATTGHVYASLRRSTAAQYIDALPIQGVIHFGGEWSVDDAVSVDQAVDSLITPLEGFRIWHRRPANTQRIQPFAPAQNDWPMLAGIKRAMDPQGVFNPGRFPYPGL